MTPLSPNARENWRERIVHGMADGGLSFAASDDVPRRDHESHPKSSKRSRSPPADGRDESHSHNRKRRRGNEDVNDDYKQARSSKFRFKLSKKSRPPVADDDEASYSRKRRKRRDEESSRSPKHRSHHKRRPKRSKPLDDDPSAYDDAYDATTRSSHYMDPDTAFRESLFDALADDEGAEYWEGVYGQPIHTYSNVKSGPDGKLERMTDEEYAEYVRAQMWEKSHEHLAEERRKREKERIRRTKEKEEREREQKRKRRVYLSEDEEENSELEDKHTFMHEVEESLLRGEERRKERKWREAWRHYVTGWENFNSTLAAKSAASSTEELAGKNARGIIPWPVDTRRWKDVEKDDVENFFRNAPPSDADLVAILKIERVRWHPDKMQQRFGAARLDEGTVKTVTAVFQVVDRLWNEVKVKKP